MATDEFGPLKKVFGFEDKPTGPPAGSWDRQPGSSPLADVQAGLDRVNNSAGIPCCDGRGCSICNTPREMTVRQFSQPRPIYAEFVASIEQELADRMCIPREPIKMDPPRHFKLPERYQLIDPTKIEPRAGVRCDAVPARLFQLRDDLIVHIDEIRGAERIRANTVVQIRLGQAYDKIVNISDCDGSLWQRLQTACTNLLILNPTPPDPMDAT